jgi:hypothetical protein
LLRECTWSRSTPPATPTPSASCSSAIDTTVNSQRPLVRE